jgi:hypothetical protein
MRLLNLLGFAEDDGCRCIAGFACGDGDADGFTLERLGDLEGDAGAPPMALPLAYHWILTAAAGVQVPVVTVRS